MGKMPWLKLYTEIRTDPKMQALSDAEFRVWINLLCLAAESKVRGVICIDQGIPYPDEALARAMYTDPDTLKGALAKFIKLRMVEIDDDGIIYLINFDARQYDKPSDRPEAVTERVRRHRAKAKAEAERQAVQEDAAAKEGVTKNDCNADVTPLKRQSNALDKEEEKDKEEDVDITHPTLPSGGQSLPADLIAGLSQLTIPDNAGDAHRIVIEYLKSQGFNCLREYPVPDRGDGRQGRIDIFATRPDLKLAIEIDRESVREKSVFKLRQVEGAIRVILLRGDNCERKPEGIDALISLPSSNSQGGEEGSPPPPSDAKAKAEAERQAVQEVFEHYCRVIKPVKLTEKRKAKIKARLADFTVDELKRVIDNLARDPWIMGDNERGKFYATIEYVFRSTEKTEEWINKFDGRKGKLNGQDHQCADAGAGIDLNLNKFLWRGT